MNNFVKTFWMLFVWANVLGGFLVFLLRGQFDACAGLMCPSTVVTMWKVVIGICFMVLAFRFIVLRDRDDGSSQKQ